MDLPLFSQQILSKFLIQNELLIFDDPNEIKKKKMAQAHKEASGYLSGKFIKIKKSF
jgi:hypothetical protein